MDLWVTSSNYGLLGTIAADLIVQKFQACRGDRPFSISLVHQRYMLALVLAIHSWLCDTILPLLRQPDHTLGTC